MKLAPCESIPGAPLVRRAPVLRLLESRRAPDSTGGHQNNGTTKGFSPYFGFWEMENGRSFLAYNVQNAALSEGKKSFGYFTATVKLLLLSPACLLEKNMETWFNLPACKWLLNNTVVFGSADQRALPMRTTLCSLRLVLFWKYWMCFCWF